MILCQFKNGPNLYTCKEIRRIAIFKSLTLHHFVFIRHSTAKMIHARKECRSKEMVGTKFAADTLKTDSTVYKSQLDYKRLKRQYP